MKQLSKTQWKWLISVIVLLFVIGGTVYFVKESHKPKFVVTIVEDHNQKSYGLSGTTVGIVMTIALDGVDYYDEYPKPISIKKITIDDDLNNASSADFGPYVIRLGKGYGISREFGTNKNKSISLFHSAEKVEIKTTEGTVTVKPIIKKINAYSY